MTRLNRDQLIAKLTAAYPDGKLDVTENFNGSQGGIWIRAMFTVDGLPACSYWAAPEPLYQMNTHSKLAKMLSAAGWFTEPYDSETFMIWQD